MQNKISLSYIKFIYLQIQELTIKTIGILYKIKITYIRNIKKWTYLTVLHDQFYMFNNFYKF